LQLEVVAKKELAVKALLSMFVNVLLLAFTPVMVRRGCSSFKQNTLAAIHAAASAAQAASS
jgi:hypothetical protein